MTNGLSILLVIPTLNEEHNIERVLVGLTADQPAGSSTLCVVADGGSSDRTIKLAHELAKRVGNIEVVHNVQKIQSAALNLAVEKFGKDRDILIRCDAHAVYPSGFVGAVVDSLRRTEADSIVVPLDSIGETCVQRAIAWISDMPLGSGGSAHRGGTKSGFVDHGHHAGFRMSTFRDLGGYDVSFSHNEDAEYDCRARASNAKIFLDATIRVGYWPRKSFAGLWRQYRSYGLGRSATILRHPASLRVRQLAVPANFLLLVGSLAACFISTKFLLWPLIYLFVLVFASVYVALSKSSACGLLSGPAAGVMHMAWAVGFLTGLCRSFWKRNRKFRFRPRRAEDTP